MLSQQRGLIYLLIGAVLIYLLFFVKHTPDSLTIVDYVQSFSVTGDYSKSKSKPAKEDEKKLAEAEKTSSSENVTVEVTSPDASSNNSFDNGLKDLCKDTSWTEGLWLQCHSRCGTNSTSICGGLNNARNRVQTCLRLAIDAGAGLILPSATTRDEKQLVNTNDKVVCPDTFWNIQHLELALAKKCLQLKIRQCDDLSGIDKIVEGIPRSYLEPPFANTTFRTLLETSFENSNESLSAVDANHPAALSFGDSFIGWDYRVAGEYGTIRKGLFKALQFNQDLLDLSTQVLESPELKDGAFIGVHLRGESDWPAGFGHADDQMRLYAEEIQKIKASVSYDMSTVYVSVRYFSSMSRFPQRYLS